MKFTTSVLSVATLAVLSTACVKVESLDPVKAISKSLSGEKKKNKSSRIKASKDTNEEIAVGVHNLKVVSSAVLKAQKGLTVNPKSTRAKAFLENLPSTDQIIDSAPAGQDPEDSLLVGFPVSLLGEQNVFGAVITGVSDPKREDIGTLKLTDLPPFHVRTVYGRARIPTDMNGDGQIEDGEESIEPAIHLIGCAENCSERSQQGSVLAIPIKEIDDINGIFYLDIKRLGSMLNFIGPELFDLRTIDVKATEVNHDVTTLLFDVKTTMVSKTTPGGAEAEAAAPKTEFTVRWYMKLSSGFNPAFEERSPVNAVGFFETSRAKETRITRFSITENGKKIKYFIKNVPADYRPHFKSALDNWNLKFKETMNIEPIAYEFIEKSDPRHAALVPGDIRYNIIEWDEKNIAGYGGLGPSIANQYTGETMSANVLIQGPTIIAMYSKWFELSQSVRTLRAQGQLARADKIMKDFNAEAKSLVERRSSDKFSIKIGNLAMNIHAQRPELEDPMIKNHFEVVPAGVTFQEYMKGYFTEMVEHELGHNLGLRHNFKGNLGATDSGQPGSASRSIMEYLGRPYRHMNVIGLYDEMAIRYGYAGEAPKRSNWFCTDEHQATDAETIKLASPECTKSDATSDPFSFWESRVKRSLDLVLDTKSASAPVWKTAEVKAQVEEFSTAFANYAAAAETTADSWTNFFGKADRPEDKKAVRPYVLRKMKALLCDPALAEVIRAKESQEAQALAQKNLDDLRKVVADTTKTLKVFTDAELKCN